MALALSTATTVAAHSGQSGDNAAVKRIFVIMLENHSQSTVIGDPNAPYITSLRPHYGEATNYYGVTHPSQPNYVAAITGQLDITRMNDHRDQPLRLAEPGRPARVAGKTWGAYMDTMPYAGYTGLARAARTAPPCTRTSTTRSC